MRKGLKLLLLSLLIVPFLTSFTYAGTLVVDDITVSKEIAEAGNYFTTPYNVGDRIGNYIVGANAGNPFVEFVLSAGQWNINIPVTDLKLCRGTTPINSQNPVISPDGKTITFPAAGVNLVNGETITLGKTATCTPLAAADLRIQNIPQGTYSVDLTVNILNILNQLQDRDIKTLVDATVYEYTAAIGTKANALINYAACTAPSGSPFANLYEGTTCSLQDVIDFTLTRTLRDYNTFNLPTTTKNLSFAITPSVTTGIVNLTAGTVPPPAWVCNAATLTCTRTAATLPATNTYTFTMTVDGTTVLSERTFTATSQITYLGLGTPLGSYQRTLFQNSDAGAWNYRGTSIKVPFVFVNTAQGKNTYIILQSKSNVQNKVWALILASDGSIVTTQLGDITPGTPFTIAGNTLAQAVTAAGKTVGERFAAIINVAATDADIFAYANVIEPDKTRFVPLQVLAP